MVPPRCGSTSMYRYFNVPYNSLDKKTEDHWRWYGEFGKLRVLVLRNPYDRVSSAYNIIHRAEGLGQTPEYFFGSHSCPYMWQIRDLEFVIIDFYELKSYIPVSWNTLESESKKNSSFNYIENPIYSAEVLRQEYIDYKTFLSNRSKMTIEAWKYLTQ